MGCKGQIWQYLRYFTFTFTKAERRPLLWQDSERIGNNWQHFPRVQVTFLNKWREQFSSRWRWTFYWSLEEDISAEFSASIVIFWGSFEVILDWIQEHRETKLRGDLMGLAEFMGSTIYMASSTSFPLVISTSISLTPVKLPPSWPPLCPSNSSSSKTIQPQHHHHHHLWHIHLHHLFMVSDKTTIMLSSTSTRFKKCLTHSSFLSQCWVRLVLLAFPVAERKPLGRGEGEAFCWWVIRKEVRLPNHLPDIYDDHHHKMSLMCHTIGNCHESREPCLCRVFLASGIFFKT